MAALTLIESVETRRLSDHSAGLLLYGHLLGHLQRMRTPDGKPLRAVPREDVREVWAIVESYAAVVRKDAQLATA